MSEKAKGKQEANAGNNRPMAPVPKPKSGRDSIMVRSSTSKRKQITDTALENDSVEEVEEPWLDTKRLNSVIMSTLLSTEISESIDTDYVSGVKLPVGMWEWNFTEISLWNFWKMKNKISKKSV
jgi:hypothetical protein